MENKLGFTLIELLVVVLIIGILAAVALPQYQRVVERSKASQGISIIKTIYHSIEDYYLVHDEFPNSFNELDVEIPWTGTDGPSVSAIKDTRSNEKWALQIYNDGAHMALIMTILSGKYTGGQFIMFREHGSPNVPRDTLLCGEWYITQYAISEKGLFCQKLFNARKRLVSGSAGGVFTFEP